MNCKFCKVSIFDKPLYRTNPKGQPGAGWMCENCINAKEPELYRNLKDGNEFEIGNDIMDIVKSIPNEVNNE